MSIASINNKTSLVKNGKMPTDLSLRPQLLTRPKAGPQIYPVGYVLQKVAQKVALFV